MDLREQLVETMATAPEIVHEPAAVESPAPASQEPASVETTEQKADRLANRTRDAQGRLLPGTKEPAATPTAQPAAAALPPPEVAAPAVAVVRAPRPASWKKDYEADWEKVATENPKLADYLNQRELEAQRGISQYRQQAEQGRPLSEAIAPFLPNLQKFNLEPAAAVRNLLSAHERLSLGSPQEKLALGAQIIRDYGIDAQALVQILTGQAAAPQLPPPQQPPQDIRAAVRAELAQEQISNAYNQFLADAPEKYPHFENVRDSMTGLLQAGLAQDYASAYEAALRLPAHTDLYDAQQAKAHAAQEAQKAAEKQAAVLRARSNAVSVKSATPASVGAAPGKDDLRSLLSSGLEAATANRL